MNNTIDEKLIALKGRLDPMLEAVNSNFKKVKTKNGFERMWLPLFIFFPASQLLSLITLGKYGIKVSKMQGITTAIIGIVPIASAYIEATEKYIKGYSVFQIVLFILLVWYAFTLIFTFLQMPNWKNENLFHIDAYRIFRPNEYKIVEPFLGTNFSIESINNFMLRNSNERAIREIKELSEAEVAQLSQELDDAEESLYDYEQNLIFLNKILIRLNDNITYIANEELDFEHLYIIDAPYCIYEVQYGEFHLISKEYPRTKFPQRFDIKKGECLDEPFAKCYFSKDDITTHEDDNSISYKIYLEDESDIIWIITFYPKLEDEHSLQALLEDSILKENELLQTANLRNLLESHCKIIYQNMKVKKGM
ncbi:hypothetical protein [Bacillus cereus]|uniref:hypothetical protein n=1 Tax=Bacillus cereus TaxID=1396 RepID=UPI003D2EFC4E